MVFPYSKRVPPKSFVRSRFTKTRGFREPRSARTPPSTFLFLHLHLSNSPGPEKSHSPSWEVRKTPFRRQMTTDWYRLLFHSSKRGASRARKHALACGPMQRRAQWPGYRPGRSALSTVLSTNRRIVRQIFATQRSRYICGTYAALEPQSCDVLTYS
jgi:hypothetical protein